MKKGVIRVATCQFASTGNIRRNGAEMRRQIESAKASGADVAHFPEAALSGYAGITFDSWDGYDWSLLWEETDTICGLARKHRIWVILGSAHRLTGAHLPHNSLYIIDPTGSIVERYDKCFCTSGDLKHYSPGNHLPLFEIHGVPCGALICYDVRFPELYRLYKRRGAQLVFHSFWNAKAKGRSIHTTIMRPSFQCRAATNALWISAPNCSTLYQSWPSVFVLPDGVIAGRLKQHRPGVMLNVVDTHRSFYDASRPFRDRAMRGIIHSGKVPRDTRSRDRRSL